MTLSGNVPQVVDHADQHEPAYVVEHRGADQHRTNAGLGVLDGGAVWGGGLGGAREDDEGGAEGGGAEGDAEDEGFEGAWDSVRIYARTSEEVRNALW